MDKTFMKWVIGRIEAFRDVAPEKLEAERDAITRQEDHNRNYADFLKNAVFPAVGELVEFLRRHRIVHRVTTWGNQLALRIHLTWRWGELVISQSHEDAISFEHHIITEGEQRGDDRGEDITHQYDLHDPLPPSLAGQELTFFMSRIAQDLLLDEQAEKPPGE
jgi:hypothetical protein